ncbi:MAG: hypothetical protein LW720_20315, partial [Pirellula sp.]|nr:hypothetical protein [Pirellula sp.]
MVHRSRRFYAALPRVSISKTETGPRDIDAFGQGIASASFLVAFDVLAQLCGRFVEIAGGKVIDKAAVTLDSLFPARFLHAFAKPLKKDVQQIAERHKRLQSACLKQRPVELNIDRNESFQVACRLKPPDDLP